MVRNDAAYFKRRAAEELLAAECATSPEAERAHRDLHRRYIQTAKERDAVGATSDIAAA
jgi:hypothetical protein